MVALRCSDCKDLKQQCYTCEHAQLQRENRQLKEDNELDVALIVRLLNEVERLQNELKLANASRKRLVDAMDAVRKGKPYNPEGIVFSQRQVLDRVTRLHDEYKKCIALMSSAGPMAWVFNQDMDGAKAWEKEAYAAIQRVYEGEKYEKR